MGELRDFFGNGSLMNGKVHVTWLVSSMCDDDGLCRVVGAMG